MGRGAPVSTVEPHTLGTVPPRDEMPAGRPRRCDLRRATSAVAAILVFVAFAGCGKAEPPTTSRSPARDGDVAPASSTNERERAESAETERLLAQALRGGGRARVPAFARGRRLGKALLAVLAADDEPGAVARAS